MSEVKKIATRASYGSALIELGKKHEDLIVLDADLAMSHSHRRSNKMWKSNVKSVKVKTENGNKKMYVCTSCLRSGNVERA